MGSLVSSGVLLKKARFVITGYTYGLLLTAVFCAAAGYFFSSSSSMSVMPRKSHLAWPASLS